MSNVQVTPRKRQAATLPNTPPSTVRRRTGNAPTPNPPSAPFPLPTRSTRRRLFTNVVEDDSLPSSDSDDLPPPKRARSASGRPLPAHLQTLLALHKGVTTALSYRIAVENPVLPPHPASETTIQLPNLTNLVNIKSTVEDYSGKQFGQQELARLAWVWAWDGETLPAESSSKKDSDNPFLEGTPAAAPKQVSGMSFLVTATRTLDRDKRRLLTYGIGLELELRKAGETRQLLQNGAVGGHGNKGVGGGTLILGRWTAAADARELEFRRRLERWVELHGGLNEITEDPTHLPSPATRGVERSTIPPIPLLPLPKHPAPTTSTSSLFYLSSTGSPSRYPGLATVPQTKPLPAGLSDPFELKQPKVVHSGSVSERRQGLYDRIKAKANASKLATLGDAVNDTAGVIHRSPDQHAIRRRATLSRLESVAETVWFLFSTPGGSSSSPSRVGRRAIPQAEVAEQVIKSSKTPISVAEAQTSLDLLMELCPLFLKSKRVQRDDWLEMPMRVLAPPSPGKDGLALGPASPGRVRRTYGLRDVRERIRHELERN